MKPKYFQEFLGVRIGPSKSDRLEEEDWIIHVT